MNIVITGGAGFIGSNLAHMIPQYYTNASITILDKFNYAGDTANLFGVSTMHLPVCKVDLADPDLYVNNQIDNHYARQALNKADIVFHLAASSHVDKSISGPGEFIHDNVVGTQMLLEYLRLNNPNLKRFIHVSTDEVYGDIPVSSRGSFNEDSPIWPNSPYAASKAASDLIALSYQRTFDMPVVVTRCSNNYGARQDKTKLIPKIIKCLVEDTEFPLYNRGHFNFRDWLNVEDHCHGLIQTAGHPALSGDVINFGTREVHSNMHIISMLQLISGKTLKIQHVQDRLGHDAMYRVDAGLAKQLLGWSPKVPLDIGLVSTYNWYMSNLWRLK